MQRGVLLGFVVVLAVSCGVLGTLLIVDGQETSPQPGTDQRASESRPSPMLGLEQVERDFMSALDKSGEMSQWSVYGAECVEANASNRVFECGVDFGPRISSPLDEVNPPPPASGTPPRNVTYRVTYDQSGQSLTWARSSSTTSATPSPPDEQDAGEDVPIPEGAPPLNDPGEAICGGPESQEEKRQEAIRQGLPEDLCEPPG